MDYSPLKILFLGETYRADAQTWIRGIEQASHLSLHTDEVQQSDSRLLRAFRFLELIFKYALNPSKFKYDIVIAERSTSYGLISCFVNTQVRIVAQQGATDLFPGKWHQRLYKGFVQKFVYRKADLIHAWGSNMALHMRSIGVPKEKILVLSKGIDLSVFKFQSNHVNRHDTWKIVVTRSLEPYYGYLNILSACDDLIKSGVDLELHIIGSGSMLDKLKQFTKLRGIETQVIFHGRLGAMDISEVLQSSQIYLSAPTTEGHSSSLLEAMACGCLPIVSDLPANSALINNGANGFLFQVNDVSDMVACIHKGMLNYHHMMLSLESNRRYIEEQADYTKNMALFWRRYKELLIQRQSTTS